MAELVHGRPSTYNNHKCRCRTEDGLFVTPQTMGCTEAWAAYIRERGYVKNYQKRKRSEKNTEVDLNDPNVGYDNPLELL